MPVSSQRNRNFDHGEPGEPGSVRRLNGFSLVELMFVVLIILIVAGVAIPKIVTSIQSAHLRGAATDYGGLLQLARIYAIRDNRYYSTYILAASGTDQTPEAYVDMFPKSNTGASGNGGASIVSGDPEVVMSTEIVQQSRGSAPNASNLQNQLLPAGSPVTPTDTSVTAATFGPLGTPCTPLALTGGSVCSSSGGPTAYWTFLENTRANTWQAVTITPAGRIENWYYTGSAWSKL